MVKWHNIPPAALWHSAAPAAPSLAQLPILIQGTMGWASFAPTAWDPAHVRSCLEQQWLKRAKP